MISLNAVGFYTYERPDPLEVFGASMLLLVICLIVNWLLKSFLKSDKKNLNSAKPIYITLDVLQMEKPFEVDTDGLENVASMPVIYNTNTSWVSKVIAMDLKDQLKNLFPEHVSDENEDTTPPKSQIWMQEDPIICKYEKRKGKPITILEGYAGATSDFKALAKELKTKLSVGGTFKDDKIIIQGDYRDRIMSILQEKGFKVKRVGG